MRPRLPQNSSGWGLPVPTPLCRGTPKASLRRAKPGQLLAGLGAPPFVYPEVRTANIVQHRHLHSLVITVVRMFLRAQL